MLDYLEKARSFGDLPKNSAELLVLHFNGILLCQVKHNESYNASIIFRKSNTVNVSISTTSGLNLLHLTLFTTAPQLNGWNITAESITSRTISVMWSSLTNVISVQDLYIFVAVCTATGIDATLRLATANVSSSNALVGTLEPYTEYQVQVVALVKGQTNRTIAMRSSSVVLLRTQEDGEFFTIKDAIHFPF